MRALRFIVLSFGLLAGACAPYVALPGAAIHPPRLAGDHVVTADAERLPLDAWLPEGEPKAVVVALHGMNDYSNAFAAPGKFLAAHGIAVYAYDQRGFGRTARPGFWSGAEAMAADLAGTTRLIAERHPGRPVYLLGESMGGAVAMVALTSANPPPVDGVILAAPAVWGRATMNVFERGALWVFSHTLPWWKLSGSGLKIKPSDNIEMLRALSRDPLVIKETRVDAIHGLVDLMDVALDSAAGLRVPSLVLYGEKDEIIPPEATWRMMATLPDPGGRQRLALYPNGYHMLLRDMQADLVLSDILAWIDDHAAPLPSLADRRAREVLGLRPQQESRAAAGQAARRLDRISFPH